MSERFNYLRPDQVHALRLAIQPIDEAFDEGSVGIVQVGSSLERQDFRDVDIRLVLKDDRFVELFGTELDQRYGRCTALWALICSDLSRRLSEQTGLPVDFQIQAMTPANSENKGKPHDGLFHHPADPHRRETF